MDDRSVYEFDFPTVSAPNSLYREGIRTVGQLLLCTEDDLLGIAHFGPVRLAHVVQALAAEGLALAEDLTRAEQLADDRLRELHYGQWQELVTQAQAQLRPAETLGVIGAEQSAVVEDAARRRTYFMSATRRVHADGNVCDHQKCPQPRQWHAGCECGWSFLSVIKQEVKDARLAHGVEHAQAGQSAW